jgi:hypothetical protein
MYTLNRTPSPIKRKDKQGGLYNSAQSDAFLRAIRVEKRPVSISFISKIGNS